MTSARLALAIPPHMVRSYLRAKEQHEQFTKASEAVRRKADNMGLGASGFESVSNAAIYKSEPQTLLDCRRVDWLLNQLRALKCGD